VNFRTITITAAAVILGAGALLSRNDGEAEECRIESQGERMASDELMTVTGTSNCETGTVLLTLEGVPFEIAVRNGLFGAEVEMDGDKPVSVRDMRD